MENIFDLTATGYVADAVFLFEEVEQYGRAPFHEGDVLRQAWRQRIFDDEAVVEDQPLEPEPVARAAPAAEENQPEVWETQENQLRVRDSALRGLVGDNRRGTRGRGVRILGGNVVLNSSLHEFAMLHGRGLDTNLSGRTQAEQLRARLVGVATREDTWILVSRGEHTTTHRYAPGAMPTAVLTAVVLDAVSLITRGPSQLEDWMEVHDRESYELMWRNYYRVECNQIGLTVRQKIELAVGGWFVARGFAGSRPPQP